jgi:hypothetical protein
MTEIENLNSPLTDAITPAEMALKYANEMSLGEIHHFLFDLLTDEQLFLVADILRGKSPKANASDTVVPQAFKNVVETQDETINRAVMLQYAVGQMSSGDLEKFVDGLDQRTLDIFIQELSDLMKELADKEGWEAERGENYANQLRKIRDLF